MKEVITKILNNMHQHQRKLHFHDKDELCVAKVPIFSELDKTELEKINSLVMGSRHKKGEILFMQKDSIDYLYIIDSGKVKFYEVSSEGKQQIVKILNDGDFFGELSIFTDEVSNLNAEVIYETDICKISKDDFKIFLRKNPNILLKITEFLSKRLSEAENLIGILSLKNSEQKIASWLLTTGDKNGVYSSNGIKVKLYLSRKEIADFLGLTIETVSRKLTQFQNDGIITIVNRQEITIHNRSKLEELSAT